MILSIMLLQATKPGVPLKPQIQRADTIVVATALNSCTYCKDNNRAKFTVVEILKGKIGKSDLTVIAPYLSFDTGTKYILFLQKKGKQFQWIQGNSSRLIATETNVKDVRKNLQIKEQTSRPLLNP